jgi:hypothetical protein
LTAEYSVPSELVARCTWSSAKPPPWFDQKTPILPPGMAMIDEISSLPIPLATVIGALKDVYGPSL